MHRYIIPVFSDQLERQKKAARLLHLLAGFLMIANAWGDFNQPTPNLLFVVVQIATALLVVVYAFAAKKLLPEGRTTNSIFRLLEAIVLLYAAWYFFSRMHLSFMGTLQLFAGGGLLLLFFSERNVFAPAEIHITEKGIQLPGSFSRRLIEWKDVENMRIRNDYISINTRQNQFLQFETGTILSELQIDEMNAWCIQQFTSGN
jgi:hypothetical protein